MEILSLARPAPEGIEVLAGNGWMTPGTVSKYAGDQRSLSGSDGLD